MTNYIVQWLEVQYCKLIGKYYVYEDIKQECFFFVINFHFFHDDTTCFSNINLREFQLRIKQKVRILTSDKIEYNNMKLYYKYPLYFVALCLEMFQNNSNIP